jgi:parvulin-like peptidyl-prolyl isomerase
MEKIYYKAKHILLEDEEDAAEIIEMIKNGKPFEEAAQEFSECDSAGKGGDLGRFPSGSMVPEFERALYNMQVGDLSDPVETKFGVHIIWRLE